MIPDGHAWKLQAACQADPGLFFPDGREGARQRDARESAAKALCAICPVFGDCLDYGLGGAGEAVVVQAILAGMNEEERRNEKRRLRKRVALVAHEKVNVTARSGSDRGAVALAPAAALVCGRGLIGPAADRFRGVDAADRTLQLGRAGAEFARPGQVVPDALAGSFGLRVVLLDLGGRAGKIGQQVVQRVVQLVHAPRNSGSLVMTSSHDLRQSYHRVPLQRSLKYRLATALESD